MYVAVYTHIPMYVAVYTHIHMYVAVYTYIPVNLLDTLYMYNICI